MVYVDLLLMLLNLRERKNYFFFILYIAILGGLRWLFPERSSYDTGMRAYLDMFFTIGMFGIVSLMAVGLGWKILHRLKVFYLGGLDIIIFSITLGYGIFGTLIFILGVLGFLGQTLYLVLFLVLVIYSMQGINQVIKTQPLKSREIRIVWRHLTIKHKVFLLSGLTILSISFLQALTPPWDYDGLMYHLQGPRLFLQAGVIKPIPDLYQANGANLVDMFSLLGLAFKSETIGKLFHVSFGLLLILSVFSFGNWHLGNDGGWLAAFIVAAIPILPIWASWAYTDLGSALFEFLGFYSLIRWIDCWDKPWLVLTGIFTGFALGSKYLALGSALIFFMLIIWYSRGQGMVSMVKQATTFWILTIMVSSPWYLRNWIGLSNPFFPFLIGGPGWDKDRLNLLMGFLFSFGTGRKLWDYLLLPINIYIRREYFTGFMSSVEIPSFLFPIALVYPFTRRTKIMNIVAFYAIVRFIIWAVGSQQTRFLLPIFPALSLMVAHVIVDSITRFKYPRLIRVVSTSLILAAGVVTLVYSFLYFSFTRPLSVITGGESKVAFLRRMVYGYPAWEYIQVNLKPEDRVLQLWDGRGYYCDDRCIPDPEQSRWSYLVRTSSSMDELTGRLHAAGISHLLYSEGDFQYIKSHDASSLQAGPMDFFWEEYRPHCTREVYSDDDMQLLKLTCP